MFEGFALNINTSIANPRRPRRSLKVFRRVQQNRELNFNGVDARLVPKRVIK
jgi:hypothetical protein